MVRVRQHRRRTNKGTTHVIQHERSKKLSMLELQRELSQFSGTEKYYRNFLGLTYTDGIKYLAERAQAFWLIDAIASYNTYNVKKRYSFQLWYLDVNEKRNPHAILTMQEDTNTPIIFKQNIPYTDFPDGKLKLYISHGVLMLPSEY